jgi:3-dehydroquinate synthase
MKIKLLEFNSSIEIVESGFGPLQEFLQSHSYTKCIIISDQTVYPLFEKPLKEILTAVQLPFACSLISPGETSKTLGEAETCWGQMHLEGLDRHSLVIGLGGGVVTDLAGFIASCYMRGIDAVYIPTTLLGMVDAAIGGKTGVNLPNGKNLIGTITHPRQILISLSTLKTLDPREISAGLAEVIKYGIIGKPELFLFLERHIDDMLQLKWESVMDVVQQSCLFKTEIVKQDEREKGERSFLNFGHTFGHAIEAATYYHTYLHGEAVAIGMCCATYLSWKLGMADREFFERTENLCAKAGLPTKLPHLPIKRLVELMKMDKKARGGKIHLILGSKIGKVVQVTDIDEDFIETVLTDLRG